MKQLWIVMLCLCVILVGCRNEDDSNPEIVEEVVGKVDSVKPINTEVRMDEEWSTIDSLGIARPVFAPLDYKAEVKPYSIADKLTNIENIKQFSGFTAKQQAMLVNNGFVVLPSQDTKMHFSYDSNEYSGIPNFITADSVLHMYHQFYDKSLMQVETDYLYEDLELMTEQMLEKSISLFNVLEDEKLKTLQRDNIIYFLVARMLLEPSSNQIPIPMVDEEIVKVAKAEVELIKKAESFVKSPLFQHDLDYSQFKVRGHYTRSDELGVFFKTMMWFGTAPLPFFDEDGKFLYDNTLEALLMTVTTFMESKETSDAELWTNIYNPTSQYVGLSDDIHVFTMNNLRSSVFNGNNDPNILNDDDYYEKLLTAIKALPAPKIQGKFTTVAVPTGKQFRFMGQRYILDSFIMQKLMAPIVRPIPSGLDVMGVIGSDVAEDLLFNEYKPQVQWPEYDKIYHELEDEVSSYENDIWGNNLYNGWLWSIQEALTEFDTDSGMPLFMTNDAWKHKSLNTALGSYTELKHDTVLYGKQAGAEMGGPIEFAAQHYVEPNLPLYSKLLYLTEYTLSVLEDRGMLNDSIRDAAKEYQKLLQLLVDCTIKELRNEALSEDENNQLLMYGGTLEYISNSLTFGMNPDNPMSSDSDMVVSDVATIGAGGNLSLGTGFYDHIYVVVPADGKLLLSRGSVYSYYEFYSEERLTDEEWWQLNGLNKVEAEFGSYIEMTSPSDARPDQPFWINRFKSDNNHVVVEPLEVNWDQLNE